MVSKTVHKKNCCAIHGCHYGDDDCPVWIGDVIQHNKDCLQCVETVDECIDILSLPWNEELLKKFVHYLPRNKVLDILFERK